MSKPGGDPSSGISSVDVLIPTERHPACRQREARLGCRTERENLRCVTPPLFVGGVKGQAASGSNREGESTDAQRRDGAACSVRWAAHESGGLKSLRRSDEGRCIQRRG
jgi:hypothetical protein